MDERPEKRLGPFGMLAYAFQRYPRRTILVFALLMIWSAIAGIASLEWWMARGRRVPQRKRQTRRSRTQPKPKPP